MLAPASPSPAMLSWKCLSPLWPAWKCLAHCFGQNFPRALRAHPFRRNNTTTSTHQKQTNTHHSLEKNNTHTDTQIPHTSFYLLLAILVHLYCNIRMAKFFFACGGPAYNAYAHMLVPSPASPGPCLAPAARASLNAYKANAYKSRLSVEARNHYKGTLVTITTAHPCNNPCNKPCNVAV